MDALSKCITSQGPRLASAASAAMGTSVRHRQYTTTPSLPKMNRRTELDYEELNNLILLDNVSLIDVRHPNELVAYGEIPGSVNIPLNVLKLALQQPENSWIDLFQMNKPNKGDRNLVFYARGPNTSRAAVEIAHRLGFKGSRHYSGGWEDYCSQTGVPLKKTPDITMNSEPTLLPQGTRAAQESLMTTPYYYGY